MSFQTIIILGCFRWVSKTRSQLPVMMTYVSGTHPHQSNSSILGCFRWVSKTRSQLPVMIKCGFRDPSSSMIITWSIEFHTDAFRSCSCMEGSSVVIISDVRGFDVGYYTRFTSPMTSYLYMRRTSILVLGDSSAGGWEPPHGCLQFIIFYIDTSITPWLWVTYQYYYRQTQSTYR